MASLKEYREEQLKKVDSLRNLGVNPYPTKCFRDISVKQLKQEADERKGQGACVAGRLLSIREHGQVIFLDIEESGAAIQIIIKSDNLKSEYDKGLLGFEDVQLLTRGDFVEVAGTLVDSQSGELSIEARGLRVLAKVLRPLPDKLEDKETRLRRRYLDMAVNPELRQRFERRSRFWQATREFLNSRDFVEVNIPVLEHTTGGADATPFVTHMDALDEDFYLRISHELPIKRLIGGGFNKVYDIGPRFRNEHITDEHLPEHVAMEWNWAYADWQDGMKLTAELLKYILQETFGRLQFDINGMQVDMDQDWQVWSYPEVIKEHFDLDVFDCSLEEVKAKLAENNLEVEQAENKARGIDKLWKHIRKDVVGPVWLIDTPAFISPLSKVSDQDPRLAQRFQAVIAGSELCNGYSELNDPVDQLQRFMEQQQMRNAGDDEAQMLDIDYVEMMEYGMPPNCGMGFSERVFWIFEGVTAREAVPFTQMRREIEATTKEIYPEVFGADGLLANTGNRVQDKSKRIVVVVNKELEPWQVANTASHMSAYHAHKMAKDEFDSGEYFVTKDNHLLPRNLQHPIIIKRSSHKELRKLYAKAKQAGLKSYLFVKEMIEQSDDIEVQALLAQQAIDEVNIYGVAIYGNNDDVNNLTKHFQLWG